MQQKARLEKGRLAEFAVSACIGVRSSSGCRRVSVDPRTQAHTSTRLTSLSFYRTLQPHFWVPIVHSQSVIPEFVVNSWQSSCSKIQPEPVDGATSWILCTASCTHDTHSFLASLDALELLDITALFPNQTRCSNLIDGCVENALLRRTRTTSHPIHFSSLVFSLDSIFEPSTVRSKTLCRIEKCIGVSPYHRYFLCFFLVSLSALFLGFFESLTLSDGVLLISSLSGKGSGIVHIARTHSSSRLWVSAVFRRSSGNVNFLSVRENFGRFCDL